MNNRRALITGAIVGLVVPVVLYLNARVFGQTFGGAEVAMWPTSILLIATEGMPLVKGFVVLFVSVLLNVGLYSAVAFLTAWLVRYLSPEEAK